MRIILLFFVVITSIFIYFDAKKQGYLGSTAYLWMLSSLFFPILVIPFYFVLTFKKRFLSNQNSVTESSIFCPKCGESVSQEDTVCPHCGNSLSLS